MQSCANYGSYRLYEATAQGSPRVVELLSGARGRRMVRAKSAEAIVDHGGNLLGFLLCAKASGSAVKPLGVNGWKPSAREEDAERSSAAFSHAEMDAIAGTRFRHGRSRTARLSEEQREARAKRIYASTLAEKGYGVKVGLEDIVERATNKLNVWAEQRKVA